MALPTTAKTAIDDTFDAVAAKIEDRFQHRRFTLSSPPALAGEWEVQLRFEDHPSGRPLITIVLLPR